MAGAPETGPIPSNPQPTPYPISGGLVRLEASPGIYRFWQDGPGYDRNLFSDSAIRGSIDFVHANPVRRRLCETVVDYEGAVPVLTTGCRLLSRLTFGSCKVPEIGHVTVGN